MIKIIGKEEYILTEDEFKLILYCLEQDKNLDTQSLYEKLKRVVG